MSQGDLRVKADCEGVTSRGILAGVILVLWINFWITYAEYVVHASRMNLSHFPVALFLMVHPRSRAFRGVCGWHLLGGGCSLLARLL